LPERDGSLSLAVTILPGGSELLETWIPDGGFKIERRRVKAPDSGSTITECLVPKWAADELTPDRSCAPASTGCSPSARRMLTGFSSSPAATACCQSRFRDRQSRGSVSDSHDGT
jgi:hypothetical protein